MSVLGFSTRQLHAGEEHEGPHRPRATPIHLTAGFVFDDFDQAHSRFAGADDGFSYTRVGNPTSSGQSSDPTPRSSGAHWDRATKVCRLRPESEPARSQNVRRDFVDELPQHINRQKE